MISYCLASAFLVTPFGLLLLTILICWKPEHNRKYVLFIALVFGLLGYSMYPNREIDISRYFLQLDKIRNYPFTEAYNWNNDGLVIKNIGFWFIAKLNNNQLLPFVSMFIVYYCVAWLISRGVKENTRLFGIVLTLEIMMLPFINIFSNVRNVVAFAIASIAVYRELYEGKRDAVTALLYLIPCFIHMTGIVIFVFRLFIIVVSRLSHIGTWLVLSVPAFILYLYPYFRGIRLPGSVGLIVQRLIWKSYSSITKSSEYALSMQESGSFLARRLITVCFTAALYVVLLQYQRDAKRKTSREYALYVETILIFSAILAVIGVVKYWIFAFVLLIAPTPIYAYCVRKAKRRNHVAVFCLMAMFGAACMSLILQFRGLYLNIMIPELISGFMLTDYLMVFAQILRGIFAM